MPTTKKRIGLRLGKLLLCGINNTGINNNLVIARLSHKNEYIDLHFKTKVVSCGTIYRAPKQDKQSVSEFLTTLKLLLETI